MRMYDVIKKKRDGGTLTPKEIHEVIQGYVNGTIPDYQMSALLMAIYFQGMNETETVSMTMEVAKSGEMMDLSSIEGIKGDKHSTGGVGDKTTLIVAPMVAACGVKVAKMSGRGLGHTGGTVDKLESIPGFRTTLSKEEFVEVVNRVGVSVIGQSGNLTPADKKLYALRDVTATVDSIPLIAVSIMSKKLAAGSDCILLDVKVGSGAFMKTVEEAQALADEMVAIGTNAGKKTAVVVTGMDVPLGNYIGNSLEVMEAVEVLKGNGPEDLREVCCTLATLMLYLAGKGEQKTCREMVEEAISSGRAFQTLVSMVQAHGGDTKVLDNTELFAKAAYEYEVTAPLTGYITQMDTEKCGIASVMLGAGREVKDGPIDYSAGIKIEKKTGDYVEEGQTIAVLYASKQELFQKAEQQWQQAVTIGAEPPEKQPLIYTFRES
jgi:pyrimidine-nucleoside phosphorylase